jgi:hypothetical protein
MYADATIPPATAARGWPGMAALLPLALFVPFITGFVSWANAHGLFPLRPAIYLGGMALLCTGLTFVKSPVFPRTTLVILALLLLRAVDAALQRWPHPEGWQDITFSLGSTFLLALAGACACGHFLTHDRRPLLFTAALSVFVCTGANVAEFLGLFQNSSVPGRAAGFIGDSNDSAIAIVCMLAVFLTLSPKFSHSALLIAVAGAGVFPTLSRSGFLVYGLTVMLWAAMNLREHFTKLLLALAALITLSVSAVSVLSSASSDANTKNRISAIFGGDVEKMESTERLKDVMDGVHAAMEKPVTGLGTGSGTALWMPHNQFVSTWIDLGIFAAAAYAAVIFILIGGSLRRGGAGLLCTVPLLGFLPFSQMLVDTSAYWLCAFTAAVLTSPHPLRFAVLSDKPSTVPAHGLPA